MESAGRDFQGKHLVRLTQVIKVVVDIHHSFVTEAGQEMAGAAPRVPRHPAGVGVHT